MPALVILFAAFAYLGVGAAVVALIESSFEVSAPKWLWQPATALLWPLALFVLAVVVTWSATARR